MKWLLIALGGGIGASLRYGVQLFFLKRNIPFYWSTIVVNLFGSYLLGISSNWLLEEEMMMAFMTTGILGAFTTYSTFAFDIVKLWHTTSLKKVIFYSGCNLIGGIVAFGLGWTL